MKSLNEILLADERRSRVETDFVQMLETFVAERGGLKGMAWRTGLSMLKKAKPGILERAVHKLLPEFMRVLDPLLQESRARSLTFGDYMKKDPQRAARALIGVADARAAGGSEFARKTYAKFRGGAEDEVAAMVPTLAKLLDRHLA